MLNWGGSTLTIIKRMQGTPAYLVYMHNPQSTRGHSCRKCEYYFDGVCKATKTELYSDNNARYCKYYFGIEDSKKHNVEENDKPNKKSVKKDTENHNKEIKRIPEGVFYGNSVIVRDIATNEVFELPPIEKDPKTNTLKELKEAFLNKTKGKIVKYKGYSYIIEEIK